MKTPLEIYREHRNDLDALHTRFTEEVNTASDEHFPSGTKVSWKMPGHKEPVEGEVTGRLSGETGAIMVRSSQGMGYTVRVWNLTRLPQ